MHTILEHQREGRRAERGFTLVELLVVVLILGVLAAVVVFSVGGITKRGNNASCETEVREVRTAIEAYRAQNNAIPATLTIVKNAGLLETIPSKAGTPAGNPGTPSGNAGYAYVPASGTYVTPSGNDTCPTG